MGKEPTVRLGGPGEGGFLAGLGALAEGEVDQVLVGDAGFDREVLEVLDHVDAGRPRIRSCDSEFRGQSTRFGLDLSAVSLGIPLAPMASISDTSRSSVSVKIYWRAVVFYVSLCLLRV